MLVMVSGGSGITPFISIVRELLFRANNGTQKTPSILLVCAFKKSVDLAMLDLILPVSGTNCDVSRLPLKIEAYATREKQPSTEIHKTRQTVWLRSDPLDVPVSAVLGQNSWLWLAMIVSVSFAIFLLLIGILTRYYIYPIDHNSNMIYSLSLKSALSMLFMCVSIATTTSLAFIWNKNQSAKKMRQIQKPNTPTSMNTSLSACFNGTQAELESLPRQSLVQATNIHYGTRPDLKGEPILVTER